MDTTFGGSSRLAPEKRSCLSATTSTNDGVWANSVDQPADDDTRRLEEPYSNYDADGEKSTNDADGVPTAKTSNQFGGSTKSYSEAVKKPGTNDDGPMGNGERNYTTKQKERMRRTMILRRIPYDITTEKVCEVIESDFCGEGGALKGKVGESIEAIMRDRYDRRRIYVTFRTYEAKRIVARKGFQLGSTIIPGEPGDVSGYIRDVPYFLDIDDLRDLLRPYGTILKDRMRTFRDTTVQMGGMTSTWTYMTGNGYRHRYGYMTRRLTFSTKTHGNNARTVRDTDIYR